ncbi:phage baseplate assembly protein V [Halogeometricum sp. CBA1124]|uniref:phage baseplate assembly protein V n=1 Tax=Halogeometricum sp. CBA1124 TaxID=2668071 RepID=UPI00142B60E8|nr:phage tail protein [Halogeometricum sp. CBA1124]
MSYSEFTDDVDDAIRGVATAIVTDNEDPEGMARVKVRYPWRNEDEQSYWARVARTMAGGDRGTYFHPEVDDEVLVAFEQGNIHYPYVIGALWSSAERPPEDNADGNNDVRMIRSRSGHQITLNDNGTAGKVEITTNAGHSILLDDASGSEKIVVADKSGQNTVELDSNSGAINVSSGATVSVESKLIDIKGQGNVTVEAGGILTLKGSLVKIN